MHFVTLKRDKPTDIAVFCAVFENLFGQHFGNPENVERVMGV